jgi:peptidoglycan/LPS O-acetylase OafA/YrhL
MARSSKVTKTYFPELDGLRTLAVFLVILVHVLGVAGLGIAEIKAHPLWRFGLNGELGVDLFFVISGFLITSILLEVRERDGSARAFWLRRVVRIFPLHYLYLIVVVAATTIATPFDAAFAGAPETVWGWLPYFLYVGNFAVMLASTVPPIGIAILWSLAIEEQFYAVWPFVIRNNDDQTLWKIIGGMLLLAPIFRYAALWAAPHSDAWFFVTVFHLDPLLVGSLVALCWRTPEVRERIDPVARWLLLPAVALVLFILQDASLKPQFVSHAWLAASFFLVAISYGIILWNVLQPGRIMSWLLGNKAMVYVGKISYGMYIWHLMVAYSLVSLSGKGTILGELGTGWIVTLTVLGTVVVASASWFGFEKPFLRLKERFPYETK